MPWQLQARMALQILSLQSRAHPLHTQACDNSVHDNTHSSADLTLAFNTVILPASRSRKDHSADTSSHWA